MVSHNTTGSIGYEHVVSFFLTIYCTVRPLQHESPLRVVLQNLCLLAADRCRPTGSGRKTFFLTAGSGRPV